jgi:2-amino-4-hydroxy-6-hydroxymethyldihydropteridine diphosphokinase
METVYIGIGSNLGDSIACCASAIQGLRSCRNLSIEAVSGWYHTEPYGFVDQSWFINGVVRISTSLTPFELLELGLSLEKKAARKSTVRWGPRTLDIDILLWETRVIVSSRLTIPHPRMHLRRFVLVPMCEIDPQVRHPLYGMSMCSLLAHVADTSIVKPYQ